MLFRSGFNFSEGLVVSQVDDDSPAEEAGLITGIVITAINGREVDNIISAARVINGLASRETVTLDVLQMLRKGLFLRHATGNVTLRLR